MPKVLGVKDGSTDVDYGVEKKDRIHVIRKTFTRTYQVLADTANDTEDHVLLAVGIPPIGFPMNGAFAKGCKVKEQGTVIHPVTGVLAGLWEVQVEFDSNIDVDELEEQDPTAKRPTVRWSGETEEEVLEKDAVTGEAIVTKAGERIVITAPVPLPVLEIKRYEHYPFDPDVMLSYANRANAAPFWGAPTGTALMLPMEVDEETIDKTRYAVATYRIKFKMQDDPGGGFKPDTWKARPLHQGTRYFGLLDPNDPQSPLVLKVATDKHSNPRTVNLSDTGEKLADDATPEFLEFNRFGKIDFNNLSLGPF